MPDASATQLRRRLQALNLNATGLPAEARTFLAHDWDFHAHPHQWPPAGNWRHWLLMGGRGSGKTRAGAEWVRACVHGRLPFAAKPVGRLALVGETFADVRDVMIEGPSGLIAVSPATERPVWIASKRRLEWPNGASALVFSSEDPDALRGPQAEIAWADELAKWAFADAVWDNLVFGLRLGTAPRICITTTPRPTALVKRLLADPGTTVTRARTADNADHLAPGFVAALTERYGGTALGRQELEGELIEARTGALWDRAPLDANRCAAAPALNRIVVAIDPPASHSRNADACGIVAAGQGEDGLFYVLADHSAAGLKPHEWAARALGLYALLQADALVAEVNQGGDMVSAVIQQVDPAVPVTPVRASRGKHIRAEPIAALYAQGRVRHVGALPHLEDEMCDFTADGLSNGRSPDRLDALVWALTALMEGGRAFASPQIRTL